MKAGSSPVRVVFRSFAPLPTDDPLTALRNSMVLDLAERCAAEHNLTIHVCGNPAGDVPADSVRGVVRGLPGDVVTVVRSIYSEQADAMVVAMLGCNPFYPLRLLREGIALLRQDDDVIVIGESRTSDDRRKVLWIGTKREHPSIHELGEPVETERVVSLLGPLDGSLVIPLRSVREISGEDDLPYVQHEIERAQLLGAWYPVRTAAALRRLGQFGEEE